MAKVTWRGYTFDSRTVEMLKRAEKISGIYFRPTQGSYSRGSLSAGTHSGGGAVDLSVRGLTYAQCEKVVKALRQVGFAAWHRSRAEGPWAAHIHGIAIGGPSLPPVAQRQVLAYKNGRNGLASNRRDKHAHLGVPFRTWEQYKRLVSSVGRVRLANLKRGKKNSDVSKFQTALRKYLVANKVDVRRLNPAGVTGYYGSETARLVNAAYDVIARKTGNPKYKALSNDYASKTLLDRIGLKYY